jgi:phage terminase large subunit-like protein
MRRYQRAQDRLGKRRSPFLRLARCWQRSPVEYPWVSRPCSDSPNAPPDSALRGLCERSTVCGLKQADYGARARIAGGAILIGVDQVGDCECAVAQGSSGVLRQGRGTLVVGDVGDGGINRNRCARENLCLMRFRTGDDGDVHNAGITRRGVREAIADLEVNPLFRPRPLRRRWSSGGRRRRRCCDGLRFPAPPRC